MKRKRIMAGILGFSLVLAGCGINSAQTDVTPKDTTEQLAKAETSEETENFTTQTTEIQTEPETETQVEPVVQTSSTIKIRRPATWAPSGTS